MPGDHLVEPFRRMAQGLNALNELNTSLGEWIHGDGWGAVYEEAERLKVSRSVAACWEAGAFESLRERQVFMIHARLATQGGVSLQNTHPFEMDVNSESWIFCHNGFVRDDLPIPSTLSKSDPTDSETVFHLLQPFLRVGDVLGGLREVYGAIQDFTSLNSFLLGPDEFWAVSLCAGNPNYYTLSLSETLHGPVISSEPLAELVPHWTPIPSGHVVRIDRRSGEIQIHDIAET